jgi:hypothetical protein
MTKAESESVDAKDQSAATEAVDGAGEVATSIRTILGGMGGGDAYQPDDDYRPPAGAPPRAI